MPRFTSGGCWKGKDDPAPYVPGLPATLPAAATLAELFAAMACCTRCELAPGRTQVVLGDGAARARVLFLGEAPGATEDRLGRPFVGAAGRLLDQLLEEHALVRGDVFITNVVACRPPGNRPPRPAEVEAHAPWLEAQIALVDPLLIVTLGRSALVRFVPGGKITELQGIPRQVELGGRTRTLLPLLHPAAVLRRRRQLLPALRAAFARIPELLQESG
jgi:uracil-DNA glycosylase